MRQSQTQGVSISSIDTAKSLEYRLKEAVSHRLTVSLVVGLHGNAPCAKQNPQEPRSTMENAQRSGF
jgi:hypothetical protein